MANEELYGTGAGLGAGLAASMLIPGLGTAAMIGIPLLGAGFGGSVGGMFGKKRKGPDISGELARIGELFAQARAAARAEITADFNDRRTLTASNLAARGTYSSPVSEASFGALESARSRAFGAAEGQLSAQEAKTRGDLLGVLLGMDAQASRGRDQASAALYGQIGSIGTSLLLASMLKTPGQAPTGNGAGYGGVYRPGGFVPGAGSAQPSFFQGYADVGANSSYYPVMR